MPQTALIEVGEQCANTVAMLCRQTVGVYEQAATAFLVRGFQERQPSQIRAAESIFQRLSKVEHCLHCAHLVLANKIAAAHCVLSWRHAKYGDAIALLANS